MAKRSLIDQLDEAVEAIIARRDVTSAVEDQRLAGLRGVALDLRDLPEENFKLSLKADLERRAKMSSTPKVAARSLGVTPYLCFKGAAKAIEFYKQAFGAKELMRFTDPVDPAGRIGHAEIEIAGSKVFIADEYPEYGVLSAESIGGSPITMHLYVEDVDSVANQAVAAGATILWPVKDQFYGDRSGRLADPFGYQWVVATHKEAVSLDEMKKRLEDVPAEQQSASSPYPEGFHSITLYLQVQGATQLIDFIKQTFDAEEVIRVPLPDGTLMHASVKVGDSMIEMADSSDKYPSTPAAIHVYVKDADAVYQRALAAGATSLGEPTDQFYGDREAAVMDRFGNHWYISTRLKRDEGAEVDYIPAGLRTVTPFLQPRGADQLIGFLRRAYGADIVGRYESPEGRVAHATVRVGDSIIEIGEAHEEFKPMRPAIHLYVGDVDAVYRNAIQAGAASLFAVRDEPYGDRVGGVTDQFGNTWYIATRKGAPQP